ncbi:MAG: Xaa-Pro peptidase family protein [Trueperaceae bacterium]
MSSDRKSRAEMDLTPFVAARQARLVSQLEELGVDAFLTFSPANRRYLSGFTGSAGYVLVTRSGGTELFTDWRYVDQARAESPGSKVTLLGGDRRLWGPLEASLKTAGASKVAFEAAHVSHAFAREAEAELKVEWVPTTKLVEGLRSIKDAYEVAKMRASLAIAEQAFEHILPFVKPGVTEHELAVELRHRMELLGAQNQPNFPILASGWRAALPHGRASDKVIEKGEFLLFDYGAILDGYYSDMTRTVVVGKADERQREIYRLVNDSNAAGTKLMGAGNTGQAVDRACRVPLLEAGYEGQIHGYSVGHGLGLEIHEDPFMSEGYTAPLQAGMVVTIEPGIYISGWGGVRIEDTVLVTESGPEVFNTFTHDLLEL